MSTTITSDMVTSLRVGTSCYGSNPCQHSCEIVLQDGMKKKINLHSNQIDTLVQAIPEDKVHNWHLSHFMKFRNQKSPNAQEILAAIFKERTAPIRQDMVDRVSVAGTDPWDCHLFVTIRLIDGRIRSKNLCFKEIEVLKEDLSKKTDGYGSKFERLYTAHDQMFLLEKSVYDCKCKPRTFSRIVDDSFKGKDETTRKTNRSVLAYLYTFVSMLRIGIVYLIKRIFCCQKDKMI